MIDYILLEKYSKDINVLFVEDDEDIRKETSELLEDIFQKNITIAVDGQDGFTKYMKYHEENNKYFDLVITDICMPKIDGVELTKLIKKENIEQKLIILSAHNESEYLMELVNVGISQFILKPIEFNSFIDIIYKISKEIYHINSEESEELSSTVNLSSNLYWDKDNSQLVQDSAKIKLTKKEFLLIALLLKSPEKTYSNDEIVIHLWKDDLDKSPDISNLKNVISRLRKKVPLLNIENIYSFGYRINVIN
ncbi:response regulator transcription factor [Poseidonibacter lekithochrous]|uniref:response regulator transcription factor n=1 Tax=Poseidonibacter lekithochrous TaxID=1904463 RepID=UPI0008FC8CCC|nr:response regulator transcription factor [Poseidonibacter lekithochrous]QKJ22950.1 two-component system response regulator, OmpR family [Poseidonibacter lekithochrous]